MTISVKVTFHIKKHDCRGSSEISWKWQVKMLQNVLENEVINSKKTNAPSLIWDVKMKRMCLFSYPSKIFLKWIQSA